MRTLFISLVPLRYTGFTRNYLAYAETYCVVRHLVPRGSERNVVAHIASTAPTSFLSPWAVFKAILSNNWDALVLFRRKTHLFVRSYQGNKAGRMRALPRLVSLEQYRYRPELSVLYRLALSLEGTPVIGQIGDFTKSNNQNFTLSVFRHLRTICPDARLLLIGDGPMRMELTAQIDYEYLPAAMPGNTLSMHTMLAAMDVLLVPANNADPYLLAEAEAAGLPCILSHKAGAKEAEDFIVLDMDAERWAEAIAHLSASGRARGNYSRQ